MQGKGSFVAATWWSSGLQALMVFRARTGEQLFLLVAQHFAASVSSKNERVEISVQLDGAERRWFSMVLPRKETLSTEIGSGQRPQSQPLRPGVSSQPLDLLIPAAL